MTSRAGLVKKQRSHNGAIAKPLKIVITGPFAAGKTTLIQSISEVAIVDTERHVSDEMSEVKSQTTVAMDFGRITFAADLSLFLFGTPGQRRFEVMWDILSDGMIGFILLINAADERSLEEAAHILDSFRAYADVPFVVGVTHLDEVSKSRDEVFAQVREHLDLPARMPLHACDARSREDIKEMLLQVLFEVIERLDRAAGDG